jgi:short-subunit dehydrogenase
MLNDIYSSYARIVAMAVNEMIGADRKDMFALRYGPWAVVTGASDGIGRSFAAAIAKSGLNLVIVARREDALRDLAERLRHDYRVAVTAIVADLSSSEESARIERETRDLDVGLLIAAAGFGVSGPFVDNDIYVELNMIDVNCRALAQLTHAFARRFATRKSGGIILMSSLVAFQGVPLAANYAATKAYVQTLAEGLHDELRPLGVDVLASAPGPVKSGFGHRAGMRIGAGQTPDAVAEASLKALGRRMTVRPGFLAKALEASLKPLPRGGRVKIMARVMAGLTVHRANRPA